MGKPAIAIELTAVELAELEGLAGRRRTAQGTRPTTRQAAPGAPAQSGHVGRGTGFVESTSRAGLIVA